MKPVHLPWADGGAALVVGVFLLALRSLLTDFYGLSLDVVTFIGAANVVYSVPGLTLGAMKRRPAWLLWFLIAANLAWAVVSTVLAMKYWSSAGVFGLLHIIGEGLFVTMLAWQEYRHRDAILQRQ